jgi:hypothetical protein
VAYEIPGFSFTLIAAADLSASQYCFVNVDNTGKAALPAANARCVGVLQNKPTSGQVCTIVASGISKALVGVGDCTAGDDLEVTGTGAVKVAAGAGSRIVAVALASGVAGNIVPVLIGRDGIV